MKKLGLFLLLNTPQLLLAQTSMDVYMIDMSDSLPFILAFYILTFISLSLLMLKLLKPRLSPVPLYITCIVGIIGAAILTWSFDNVQKEQLPQIENLDLEENKLSPQMKEQLMMRKREVVNQQYANFWIISVPNFIILGIGIFSDLNYKKRDPSKHRGRYD